jgi:hypothetical protein
VNWQFYETASLRHGPHRCKLYTVNRGRAQERRLGNTACTLGAVVDSGGTMADERAIPGDERAAALAAWRGFRRDRPAADEGVACLLRGAADHVHGEPQERRRNALIERAIERDGLPRDFAELIHDTAEEEGLEPAFAFELVRCRVGVVELDQLVYPDAGAAESVKMEGPPRELIAPEEAGFATARERRLRTSFRRLRRHLEASGTPEEALSAFAAEPDVGRCRY